MSVISQLPKNDKKAYVYFIHGHEKSFKGFFTFVAKREAFTFL